LLYHSWEVMLLTLFMWDWKVQWEVCKGGRWCLLIADILTVGLFHHSSQMCVIRECFTIFILSLILLFFLVEMNSDKFWRPLRSRGRCRQLRLRILRFPEWVVCKKNMLWDVVWKVAQSVRF
jgi:hypothetical protein